MTDRNVNNLLRLLWVIAVIGFLWEGLEMMFYGEVQPRRVDDIITLIWIAAVVKAYWLGYKDGQS